MWIRACGDERQPSGFEDKATVNLVVDWPRGVTSPAGGGMCHRQALGRGSPGA
jgi:hypothetical protein